MKMEMGKYSHTEEKNSQMTRIDNSQKDQNELINTCKRPVLLQSGKYENEILFSPISLSKIEK